MNLRDLLKGIKSAVSTGGNNLKSWGRVITTPQPRQNFNINNSQPKTISFDMGNSNLRSLPDMVKSKPVNFSVPKTQTTTVKVPKREIIPGGWQGVKDRLKQGSWKDYVLTTAGPTIAAQGLTPGSQDNKRKTEQFIRGVFDAPTFGLASGVTSSGNDKWTKWAAPKNDTEKNYKLAGKTISGTALTLPMGGVGGAAMRVIPGTLLGVGQQAVGNILSGQPLSKDMGSAAMNGAANSWQLAFTNLAADKIAIRYFPKLTDKNMGNVAGLLSKASNMGMNNNTKGAILMAGAKRLFGRALLEAPIETTYFSAVNNLSADDKRGFLKSWITDLPENILSNLAFAGLSVAKRGTYDFNKQQIDSAVSSLKNNMGKYINSEKYKTETVAPVVAPIIKDTKPIEQPITNIKTEVPIVETPKIIAPEKTAEVEPIKLSDNTDALQNINDAIKSGDIAGAQNLHQTFSESMELPKFEDMVAQSKPETPIVAPVTSGEAKLSELEQLARELQNKKAEAATNAEVRTPYEKGEISLFNQVKKMLSSKAYQEGDVETLRQDPSRAKTIEMATQTVMAKNPNITDEQSALEFIQNFPTDASTKVQPGPVKQSVIDTAYAQTVANGGVTISLKGDQPADGFAYAPFKGTEQAVSKAEFTPEHIDAYTRQHINELNQPGNNIGMWEENGQIYMDVSRVGAPNAQTLQEAINGQQLAVFDLKNFETIPLGEMVGGKYNQLYEATNHPYFNRGQNSGTDISGDQGSVPEVPRSPSESPSGESIDSSLPPELNGKPKAGPGERAYDTPDTLLKNGVGSPELVDKAQGLYKIKPNDETVANVNNTFDQIGYEEAKKLALSPNSPLTDENNLLGVRVLLEAQKLGNTDEEVKIIGEIVKRAHLTGRALQVYQAMSRMTVPGMLKYAYKEIRGSENALTFGMGEGKVDKLERVTSGATVELNKINQTAIDEIGNELAIRFGGQMKVDGTESVPSKTTAGKIGAPSKEISKDQVKMDGIDEMPAVTTAGKVASPEQTTSTGRTKTGIIIKGKKSGVESTQEKIDGVEVTTDPEKMLADRVRNYVKDPKETKKDPIREMVNTLFTIAKKTLPEKTKKISDPMALIANAIVNKEEYKQTWNEAKRVLEAKYGKNSKVMEAIETFLTTELTKPFPESKLNTEVGKGIKENNINIAELVKKYYTEVYTAKQSLSDYLVEKAGLDGAHATELETYISQRFDEITSLKKTQLLEKMLNPVKMKPQVKKDIIQKMVEMSNLGAFDNTKYFQMVADKIGIKQLDPELAKYITENMQKIQGMEDGEAKDNVVRDVLTAINKKIGLKVSDYATAYRYQNILSGPGTQLRNIYGNALQSLTVREAQLGMQAILEFGRKVVDPSYERKVFFSDIPQYYADLVSGVGEGRIEASRAIKGIRDVSSPDLTSTKQSQLPTGLKLVTNFMEATDKMFQGSVGVAEEKLNLRHGMDAESAKAAGTNRAQEILFRKQLDPNNLTGQGGLLSKIDFVTMKVTNLRNTAPGLSWFVPFITTPLNVAKQMIEYNPLTGWSTMIGNTHKTEQLSKQMVGGVAMFMGAVAAGQGNTTWAAPTDKREKELWYASGRKPYSFKVTLPGGGEKWIPMSYLGILAPAFAFPAALRDQGVDNKNALTTSTTEKIMGAASGLVGMYADQTYLTSLSNWAKLISGDVDYSTPSNLAFVTEQAAPASGLVRWVNQILDPRFIEAKGDGFWQTYGRSIQKDVPYFSQALPAYQTPIGEDSKRDLINSFLPYGVGSANDIYEMPLDVRQGELQQKAVENKNKKESESYLEESKRGGMFFGKKDNKGDTANMSIDDKKLKAVAYTFGLDKVMAMPESTNVEQIAKRQEAFKVVDKVLDSEYPDEVKSQLYQAIGLDEGTAKYYNVARENVEYRTAIVAEKLQSAQSIEEATKILTDGMMPINSKKIVTDDVITALQKQGIIGESLAKWLKKLEWDPQTGTIKSGSASKSGGGGSSVSFPSTAKLAKPTKMTMPKQSGGISTGGFKKIRSPFIKIKTPKL